MGETINTSTQEPSPWEHIARAVDRLGSSSRVLDASKVRAGAELEHLRVSARSTLGAVVQNCGAIILYDGWLRILGCGQEQSSSSVSAMTESLGWWRDSHAHALCVAVDALGGVFIVNGDLLPNVEPGDVAYFAPESLRWQPCRLQMGPWLMAMLEQERADQFYAHVRWHNWQSETRDLELTQGLSIYPPLWTTESRPIEQTTRRPIPLSELVLFHLESARQIGA